MSGDIGKSWKMDTIPPWLMKPCCMLTPSSDASSPDCRPPLMRASKALLPPPVLTPGISVANAAAARGPLFISSGSWLRVSGAMPCSCVPVTLNIDDPPTTSTRESCCPIGNVISTRCTELSVTSISGCVTCWNPLLIASTAYLPGGKLRNEYSPLAVVTVVAIVWSVATLRSVTATSATTPPVESLMTPVMAPLTVWPEAAAGSSRRINTALRSGRRTVMGTSPSMMLGAVNPADHSD